MNSPNILCLTNEPLGFSVSFVSEQAIKTAAATLGKRGGSAKSKAKTRAARANGKKGGRPRKVT